jgi:hypothetical protein
MLEDPGHDLVATIAVAQHVVDEYATYTSRLVHARDSARAAAGCRRAASRISHTIHWNRRQG